MSGGGAEPERGAPGADGGPTDAQGLLRDLAAVEQGRGRVGRLTDRVRLTRPATTDREYSNAQLGDPGGAARWHPPLTLALRARFSHPIPLLRGTAGFGFWNAALAPGTRLPRAPRAVWFFFGGPPHDVPLALGVPGRGFKAAVIDAHRPAFYALLPLAPIGFLAMRWPAVYRRLWPVAQRAIAAREASLDHLDVATWHDYTIRWQRGRATFGVDGREVLDAPAAPPGPLTFVAWVDNAYAIATPRGRFGMGLVAEREPRWLEISDLEILDERYCPDASNGG